MPEFESNQEEVEKNEENNRKTHKHENRAASDFMDNQYVMAEMRKNRYVNMRETLLDVLIYMEENEPTKLVKKLKRRVLDSRSTEELRMVMDGLLVTSMAEYGRVDETDI